MTDAWWRDLPQIRREMKRFRRKRMRPKLTMCKGLPGSGKTTWAQSECVREGFLPVRVNQDDIRKELGWTSWEMWNFKGPAERQVYEMKRKRIREALQKGLNVISDDTNLGRARKVEMEEIARENDADFEIQDFTKVPIDECVRRDALRPENARVGERVIRKMATTFQLDVDVSNDPAFAYTRFAPVGKQDSSLPRAIICDLDGTLALFKDKGHRGPYDASRCDEDDINDPVAIVIDTYTESNMGTVIYLSGREEKYREPTLRFMEKWNTPTGPLFMRETGDKRTDWIVKGELFYGHVYGKYYIDFVLDDRNQVVNFWRHIGLTCFQVAEGSF